MNTPNQPAGKKFAPALAVLLSAVLILLAGTPANGQELVQNGGFESGDFTGWTPSGNTNFTTVVTNSAYAHSGNFGAQLGPSNTLGFILQNLATTPGQKYALSLWLDSPDGQGTNIFRVAWNGTNIFAQTNIPALGWTNLVFTNLLATSNSTRLRFGFQDDPSYLGLDDISVTNSAPASISPIAYTFTTLAGMADFGSADGVGVNAQFEGPTGITVDQSGNAYVVDSVNDTLRMITPAAVVTTIAGLAGSAGTNDGIGSAARFNFGQGGAVAMDNSGNLYVADSTNDTIRRLALVGANWVVTTIAGSPGVSGTNDGMNGAIRFNNPAGVAVDSATNIYVADRANFTLRKLTPAGTNWMSSTIAGKSGQPGTLDGTNNIAQFFTPSGLALDAGGNLYVADLDTIRKVRLTGANWIVTTLAGQPGVSGFTNANGTNAQFSLVRNLVVDGSTNIYAADYGNNMVRKIAPSGTNWVVTTLAGSMLVDGNADGTGTNASFRFPYGLALDSTGRIYVTDYLNSEIRLITSAGLVTTLAGSAIVIGANNGVGGAARFFRPQGVAVDRAGNVIVADTDNSTIRVITAAGSVSTPYGSPGTGGTNDGVGNNARFGNPIGVAVDSADDIFVADSGNDTIRMITPAGVVSTIAGLGGSPGTNDGPGGIARFNRPAGIAVDDQTNVYVADTGNYTIRELTRVGANWMAATIAGAPGISGTNDGAGIGARFGNPSVSGPQSIAADSAGNLCVADTGNYAVRELALVGTNWVVSTLLTSAPTPPLGIAVDRSGNIFTTKGDSTIQKLTPVGISAVAVAIGGVSNERGSQDGAGAAALFDFPFGIAVDNTGNVYVADDENNTIRKGVFTQFGSANQVPYTPPALTGKLQVTLLPPEAGGQWRFPWEVTWHDSGFAASNLAAGNYPVEFRNMPGWLAIPANLTATNPAIVTASGISQITNYYYPTSDTDSASGSLTVNLGANPPNGAGWRFLGDITPFFASNFTTNLLPGTYLLQFAGPFSGRATPPNASIQIFAGQPAYIQVTYPFAAAPPPGVLLPVPVPASEISDVADYPFGFNGQLQTDVGYGSGVVVQSNVVLTAAHLIFNDETLSYVSGAYFFLQQEVPSYAPSPLTVRGWYVLSGYAEQRTNDLNSGNFSTGASSPQSRNFDVAALYFQSPAADGGYGGYLPSDDVPNQWLTGSAEKMLVGYPVDGSQYGFANIINGAMYEIAPQPYSLGLDSESVTNQQEVYTAPWFLSYPGNSGGPLYVQLNGYYYPAAVYLGTLNGQSVVRAIDSNVVNLITLAATLGDSGTNNNGGGVITIIPNQSISAFNPGYLQVQLGPPAAVQAGAAWLLQPSAIYSTATNFTQVIFSTNAVSLQFKPIPGWNVPTNQSVVVVPGNISTPAATYTVLSPTLLANAQGIGLQGTTNTTYRIETTASLNPPAWVGLGTNTIVASGFNLVVPAPANPATTFYRAVWLNK